MNGLKLQRTNHFYFVQHGGFKPRINITFGKLFKSFAYHALHIWVLYRASACHNNNSQHGERIYEPLGLLLHHVNRANTYGTVFCLVHIVSRVWYEMCWINKKYWENWNIKLLHIRVGHAIVLSSQTDFFLLGTTFSHYLYQKHNRKTKI